VTGNVSVELATALKDKAGIKQTGCYGREWISGTITKTPRLRWWLIVMGKISGAREAGSGARAMAKGSTLQYAQ
jgi:hypothetical protein